MGKDERLKSRKLIERIFRESKSFALFPFRIYYAPLSALSALPPAPVRRQALPAPGSAPPPEMLPGSIHRDDPSGAGPIPPSEALVPAPTAEMLLPAVPSEALPSRAPVVPPCPVIRLQAGFGASSRNFKKAVDRNRIKRLIREAYRLQKNPLYEWLKEKDRTLAVFFIYTGKELPDYGVVKDKIGLALQKLMKETGSGLLKEPGS